jgi:peptide chain release factor 2
MDFNGMILRMFSIYFENNNFKFEVIEEQYAEQNLLREATIIVKNKYAYGYFKKEAGIHRLTRVSPFGNGKLHTSFMEIQVLPIIEKPTFTISKKDLRVDTYRGSGAGGQHRNKTDSAVRITHAPSGIVVCCESERSQITNRETAMKQLYSKLHLLYEEKFQQDKDCFKNKLDSHWGNQIRSYLFNNNLVKDHVTNKEYNINSFLNGDIDNVIKEKLVKQS